jgi:hypothetical protein
MTPPALLPVDHVKVIAAAPPTLETAIRYKLGM